MKLNLNAGLTVLGAVLLGLTAQAQQNPATTHTADHGAMSSQTHPGGPPALRPDSLNNPNSTTVRGSKPEDFDKKAGRRTRRNRNTDTNSRSNRQSTNNMDASTSTTTSEQAGTSATNGTGTPMKQTDNAGNTSNMSNANMGTGNMNNMPSGTANGNMSTNTSTTSGNNTSTGSSNNTNMSTGTTGSTMSTGNTGATNNSTNMSATGANNGAMNTTAPSPNANGIVTTGIKSNVLSIADYASASTEHKTFLNALQTAELTEQLRGTGNFTVFAPTDVAFKKLPARTQSQLLNGQNSTQLKNLMSYHVVDGIYDAKALRQKINEGNGKAELKTLSGGTLTVSVGSNGAFKLVDEQGGVSYIDPNTKMQSNGIVYTLDKVLLPSAAKVAFR